MMRATSSGVGETCGRRVAIFPSPAVASVDARDDVGHRFRSIDVRYGNFLVIGAALDTAIQKRYGRRSRR